MSRVANAVDFFDMVGQTEWNRALQRTLIHWMGVHHTHDVLDVGCGAGRFIMQLAQRSRWVNGLDVSGDMVRRAELNSQDYGLDNTSFVTGDVKALPFPDKKFDIVLCLNLLFMYDNPVPALQELLRVCKTDGQVIVLNPSTQLNPWTAQTYCEKNLLRDFERDSLLSWATAAARHGVDDLSVLQQRAVDCGGTLVESQYLMDGLAVVSRVCPCGATPDGSAVSQ